MRRLYVFRSGARLKFARGLRKEEDYQGSVVLSSFLIFALRRPLPLLLIGGAGLVARRRFYYFRDVLSRFSDCAGINGS